MSEELSGPKKSKDAIQALEEWLGKNCKGPTKITDIESKWQYISGHEPRKTRQYLKAIETGGRIRIYSNSGEKMCALSDFMPSEHEAESELKSKNDDIIEKHMLREKMLAGPCRDKCTVPWRPDLPCTNCSEFRKLKNKEFLEE